MLSLPSNRSRGLPCLASECCLSQYRVTGVIFSVSEMNAAMFYERASVMEPSRRVAMMALSHRIHPRLSSSLFSSEVSPKRPRSASWSPVERSLHTEVRSSTSITVGPRELRFFCRDALGDVEQFAQSPSYQRTTKAELARLSSQRMPRKTSNHHPRVHIDHGHSGDIPSPPSYAGVYGFLVLGSLTLYPVEEEREKRESLPLGFVKEEEDTPISTTKPITGETPSPDGFPMSSGATERSLEKVLFLRSVLAQKSCLCQQRHHGRVARFPISSTKYSLRVAKTAFIHNKARSISTSFCGSEREAARPAYLSGPIASCAEPVETEKETEGGATAVAACRSGYLEQPVIKVMNELGPCVVRVYRVKRRVKVKRHGRLEASQDWTTGRPVKDQEEGYTVDYLGSGFVYKPEGVILTAAHLFDAQVETDALNRPDSEKPRPIGAHQHSFPEEFHPSGHASSDSLSHQGRSSRLVACCAASHSPASPVPDFCASSSVACQEAHDELAEMETAYVVKLSDGRLFRAAIEGVDVNSDVAVLRVEAPSQETPKLPHAKTGQRSRGTPRNRSSGDFLVRRPVQGELVVACGATEYGDEPVGVCGVVCQPQQAFLSLGAGTSVRFIQLGLITLPGMSGSPVCNLRGEVVGMVVKKFQDYGLALPIQFVLSVAAQLEGTGTYTPPSLGLIFRATSDSEAIADFVVSGATAGFPKTFSTAPRNSLLVDGIVPGSAAEKAGLRRGDLVTEIDGTRVTALSELFDWVTSKAPGDKVTFKIKRGSATFLYPVTLSAPNRPSLP